MLSDGIEQPSMQMHADGILGQVQNLLHSLTRKTRNNY